VADEVRKLAERTSDAAKDITMIMEENLSNILENVSMGKNATEVLNGIVAKTSEVAEKVRELSSAFLDQAQNSSEITETIMQLNGIMEDTAASAEETNAAVERIVQEIRELRKIPYDRAIKDSRPAAKAASEIELDPEYERPIPEGTFSDVF